MSMIPNPKKNVLVDFSLIEAQMAVEGIPGHFQQKFTLIERNDMLKMYTFSALEFLSIGVYVDVQLSSLSDTKTDIIVEVRRKMGAFDQWVEVQNANQHIANIFNAMGVLLPQARATRAKHLTPVNAENPFKVESYPHSWDTMKQHIMQMVQQYPGAYQLASDSGDAIVLNRSPQGAGDHIKVDRVCLVKITGRPGVNGNTEVRYEVTNDSGRIETQGELELNTAVATVTAKLVGQTFPAAKGSGGMTSEQKTQATILIVGGIILLAVIVFFSTR